MGRHIELYMLRKITNDFSDSSRIGGGGYGDVYKGEYKGKLIAVKVLRQIEGIGDAQFLNELRNHRMVQHPNIVQLVGYCNIDEKRIYEPKSADAPVLGSHVCRALCFEYIEGGNLEERLSKDCLGNDNWRTHYNIIKGICQGLCCLHKASILHLDLKPANILLDKDMTPKIADFGLSMILIGSHSHVILEKVAGTKKYMPPELKHQSLASQKTDIFSLGVTIIDIMAGPQGYNDFSFEKDVEFTAEVLKYWTERNMTSYLHEVGSCIKIAIQCVHPERNKRPTVQDILCDLNNMESHMKSMIQEDTTPAEEAPRAKKINIGESAFRKGKNELGSRENAEATSMQAISSSSRGLHTEHKEKRKLYPPRSFSRRYPTNGTYIGSASHRVVDAASGAMGMLLDKLGKLVTEDYSLDTSIKKDVMSFSDDLMIMHQGMRKHQNVDRAKIWVDELRKLSYNIEDIVDNILVYVESDSTGSVFREQIHGGLKIWENGMMTQHQIGDVIKDIKDKVQGIANKGKHYNTDITNIVPDNDPRIGITRRRNQLIGIEEPRKKIQCLLEEDGDVSNQELKIVSIVGMGGLGKTTLAKAVFDLQGHYDFRYFVSLGQKPNLVLVLEEIIQKLVKDFEAKNLKERALTQKLQELLQDKRYFIVIDDIWDSSSWNDLQYAFPENNCSCRVIATTRNLSIALHCCNSQAEYVYEIKPLSDEYSEELFFRRIFGPNKDYDVTPRKKEIAKYILERCRGMPLAINSIGGLLAGVKDSRWEYVLNSLDAMMTEEKDLTTMEQILNLSYKHLPDHLKTCLLYVCMYKEDEEIDKKDLLRKWVAEGFVHLHKNGVLDAEDIAEQYFEELINMCLIQPEKIDYNNEVLSCRVHEIIFYLMRSKSAEMNFTHAIDGLNDVTGEIHRLSISLQTKDQDDTKIMETIKKSALSHVRSVLLHGSLGTARSVPHLLELKYLRVLHLQHFNNNDLKEVDLSGINRLFLLRYLKVASNKCAILKLPNQIGELLQLETIDIQNMMLLTYPSDIVSLPCLLHLEFDSISHCLHLPEGIERLKLLRTLVGVDVFESSVENIRGLSKLSNLRKLKISCHHAEVDETISMRTYALQSSIVKLSTSLRVFTCTKLRSNIKYVHGWSSRPLFHRDSHIQELDLCSGTFKTCPVWIGELAGLTILKIRVLEVDDSVSIVAGLRSLAYFLLVIDRERGEKEEHISISGKDEAFKALKHLIFYCKKASLTFEPQAMPKLEKLQLRFRHSMNPKFLPVGIQHLSHNLEEITLHVPENDRDVEGSKNCSNHWFEHYRSEDQDEAREYRRHEGAMLRRAFEQHHPDARIVIYFNGNKEEDYDIIDSEEDYDSIDNEEDYDSIYFNDHDEEGDDEVYEEEDDYHSTEEEDDAYQVNEPQTSAQFQDSTRQ